MPRAEVTGARRVVVKVGSSSLTTAAGGLDPERLRALVDVLAGAARPRRRGGAGLLRRHRRRARPARAASAARGPGRPAGGRRGRPGPARAPLHRRARPPRHRRRAGAAHRRRRHPARALPQRLPDVRQAARARACCRSSTRTTPSPPPRSASATTTGSPRWWPTSCTPTCWCCSPTSTASTTATPAEPGSALVAEVAADADLGRRTHRAGGHGRASAPAAWLTKVEAARIATGAGIPVVLTSAARGRRGAGRRRGRHAVPRRPAASARPGCSGWPTPPAAAAAALDAGAVRAVVDRRASLLAAGITGVGGSFVAGDPVDLVGADGARRGPRPGQLRRRRAARRCSAAPRSELGGELGAGLRARGRPPRRPRAHVTRFRPHPGLASRP